MTEIKIINSYTRRIAREYKQILRRWSDVWIWQDSNAVTKINAEQLEIARDFLVREMCWVSQEQIDNMNDKDFEKIMSEIESIISESESEEKKN